MENLTTEEIIKDMLAYIADDNTENDDFKALLQESQKRIA